MHELNNTAYINITYKLYFLCICTKSYVYTVQCEKETTLIKAGWWRHQTSSAK